MKLSKFRIVSLLFALITFLTVNISFGEDYLVIKKKSGSSQKVPLNFSPDQIESFQVESGPKAQQAETGVQQQLQTGAEKDTRTPRERPAITSDEESVDTSRPSVFSQESQPLKQGPPTRQILPQSGPTRQTPGPEKTPSSKPSTAELSQALQASPTQARFNVSVFKLPEGVASLPDFSAFRPSQVLTTDHISVDPAKGENEPSGLPEKADNIGLRAIGTFLVTGEGLFRWRVQSKDGVRLHIDDKTLIENDGVHETASKDGFVHLAEGVHSIILDSFNSKGSPLLKLFVQPPIGQEQIFSISNGLAGWKEPAKPYDVLWGHIYFVPQGNYPEGPDFNKLSPIGRLIAPQLDISGGGFPGIPGRKDMIGLKYQGFFNVDGAGIFAFRLLSDNFARLTIGKSAIVELPKGSKNEPQGSIGWAFLQQGSYPIVLDYFHPQGESKLELFVTQPTKTEELFSPAQTLTGFSADSGKLNLIPAFVYFIPPNTKKMPNFNKLSPAGMFFSKSIDYPVDRGTREFPGIPKREEWFGIRFYVKFSLSDQESGTYKFRIVCDDSARLIIGKKIVVNAEGGGVKPVSQTGSVELTPGSHEMFLDYLQTTGPDGLQLFITPPGGQEKIFSFE
ncbi:MAG: PA14 domain-containing protein [Deltaproteobacteria bacterium]|nr:PA14 domain-containing protein [Deltaproteobacteria bacterium]